MPSPMAPIPETGPARFAVKVDQELSESTIRARSREVNLLLRIGTISGQQMQLDATLNMLCERARQITTYDHALTYFWNETDETFQLRGCFGINDELRSRLAAGNIANRWASRE